MGTLYMLNETGHGTISWNDKKSADIAKKTFDDLRSKGWMTVQTFPNTNTPPKQIHEFNSDIEDILMLPQFVGG